MKDTYIPKHLLHITTFARSKVSKSKKGVTFIPKKNRYAACIREGNKKVCLGYYKTQDEAFEAYKLTKISNVKQSLKDAIDGRLISSELANAMFHLFIERMDSESLRQDTY